MSGTPIVFINGSYLPVQEAKISVLDRGFLFGDGIYEVIPVYGGRLFRFPEHLKRLDNSLSAIDIANPYPDTEWENICNEVITKNPGTGGEKSLYVQVTRGIAGERDHLYNDDLVPTVLVMCRNVTAKNYDKGVTAITRPEIRWQHCHIKAITLLPNIMLKQLAFRTDGSSETILIRDGLVTEGAASNVFVVKDEIVSTPQKDDSILPGITRDLVVELLHDADITCYETSVTERDLLGADEIWITGSLAGIAPVVRLNGMLVGDGKPGRVWHRASALFQQYKTVA